MTLAARLGIERLSKTQVREEARSFRERNGVLDQVPVDIEHIIDVRLCLDISPVKGLQQILDVVAFISSDLCQITVDENAYYNIPDRYRFSLAHEIAHLVLHPQVFEQFSFGNIEGYQQFLREIGQDPDYLWMERQANWFAAYVLVPPEHLEPVFCEALALARSNGMDLRMFWADGQEAVCGNLGRRFEVSKSALRRRLVEDKLDTRYLGFQIGTDSR